MLPSISTQQIQIFLAVADAGGFARAAESLFLTQSAVSKTISRLEQQLGFSVFRRTTRSFELTEQGKLLYDLWSSHLRELSGLLSEIASQRKGAERQIRIGFINTVRPDRFLWGIIGRFERSYPDFSYLVESEPVLEIVEKFVRRDFDMIFVPDFLHYSLDEAGMPWKWAARDRAQLIVPVGSPLAERESLRLADVCHERFACLDEAVNDDYYRDFIEKFSAIGVTPQIGKRYKTASSLRSIHRMQDGPIFTDSYFDYEQMSGAVKIPILDCDNGILCSWQKNSGFPLAELAALV